MTPTREEFLYFSLPEKILFYVLVYASLGYLAWQVAQRVRLWMQGRALVEGGKLGWPSRVDAKRWLANISVFVLAQKKVRSSRKTNGAPMHLAIFYGFLTLLLATTLLGINTYSPIKFHHGLYFLIYEMTADVMGLVFVIGVVWAFVRRHRMIRASLGSAALSEGASAEAITKQSVDGRRRPLSHNRTDDISLGILFALGLTGFWLEAARLSVNPKPWDWSAPVGHLVLMAQGDWSGLANKELLYKSVWWFHAVWVFAFFCWIPRMRLRHILLAVSTIAGKPEQAMGELKPISMEEVERTEQIGVKHAKDYSRWHLMSLDACMECGRCTEVCPAWNVGKVLNPKQVVQDLRQAMVDGSEVAAAVSEEALWACTTCNACVEACPVLIRHVDLIVDARRNLVSEGKLAGSAATMLRQTASTGNAWGAQASNREDWMKDLDIPLCRDGVEFDYLFWVGCAGATDSGAIKTTKAVAQLLKQAGIRFACLGKEEACTGDPARRIGEEFLFQEKAAQNVSVFQKYGVRRVVTACPHCLNTFKNEYGQMGAEPMEVFHHSQLLGELVRKGDLKAATPARGSVVFHDPCYLGRVNDESDAPRMAWQPDALAEPENRRMKTRCCGAGGGRMWMEESPTQRPSNRRAEELLETGADTVAVGCPFCRIMLGDSLKQVAPDREIRLLDLAEALQEANPAP